MLAPFPFTDLSGAKRRPARAVSPAGFREEDLILCAIAPQLPEKLPKRSVVEVGKLFTMHRGLITGGFGTAKEQKLEEVLDKPQTFFTPDDPRVPQPWPTSQKQQISASTAAPLPPFCLEEL